MKQLLKTLMLSMLFAVSVSTLAQADETCADTLEESVWACETVLTGVGTFPGCFTFDELNAVGVLEGVLEGSPAAGFVDFLCQCNPLEPEETLLCSGVGTRGEFHPLIGLAGQADSTEIEAGGANYTTGNTMTLTCEPDPNCEPPTTP